MLSDSVYLLHDSELADSYWEVIGYFTTGYQVWNQLMQIWASGFG